MDSRTAQIHFVDFGNFEEVPVDCIRLIKPEWLRAPLQQYIAVLHGIELVSDSLYDEVMVNLKEYCGVIKLAEIVTVDPLTVKLYEEDGTLSYQALLDHGLFIYDDPEEY